jgi:uncharacterized protein YjbI with pentapeptide repeats
MGSESTYEILGLPNQLGLCLLLVAFVVGIAPYSGKTKIGNIDIPRVALSLKKPLKIAGPILFAVGLLMFIPYWTPLLAQKDYLQALDYLQSEDANHRLAAVQSFDESGQSSVEYHWLMLQQIPAALRVWAGPAVLKTEAPDLVVPTTCPTVEPVTSAPLSERPGRLLQRASATANKIEVITALWALSGRNLKNEAVKYIPARFREMDRSDNFDSDNGPTPGLESYREQLELRCTNWVGQDLQAMDDLGTPLGTDRPEQRVKKWIVLTYINFASVDIPNIELAGVNMAGCQFNSANLSSANFTKAILEDARFDEAELWNSALVEVDMARVYAPEADFGQCDLRGAWLKGADLVGSNFYHANLDGAFLMGADMTKLETMAGATARRANFWRAKLVNARIASEEDKQTLEKAQDRVNESPNDRSAALALVEAQQQAALDRINFEGAFFRHADLRGAYFWNVDLKDADLTDARLDYAELTGVDLREVKGLRRDQLAKTFVTPELLPAYLNDVVK